MRNKRTVRIGSARGNDVLVKMPGISARHVELHFSEDEAGGQPALCVRDLSRNGTGMRDPSLVNSEGSSVKSWEALVKGVSRVIGEGWQLKVPLKSRKNTAQVAEAARTLTLKLGPWTACPPEAPKLSTRPPPVAAPPPVASSISATVAYAPPALPMDAAAKKAKQKKEDKKDKKEKKKRKEGLLQSQPMVPAAATALPPVAAPVLAAQAADSLAAAEDLPVGGGRWRRKKHQPAQELGAGGAATDPSTPRDLYAEIDKEIGLNVAAGDPSAQAPAAGPVGGVPTATRPKKRARPHGGGDGEVAVGSSDEGEAPPPVAAIRLTQASLAAVAGAAAAAQQAQRAAPGAGRLDGPFDLPGQSMLRDMSVSPISTPGVGIGQPTRKKRKKVPGAGKRGSSEDSANGQKQRKKAKKDPGLRQGLDPGYAEPRHAEDQPPMGGKKHKKKEKDRRSRSGEPRRRR